MRISSLPSPSTNFLRWAAIALVLSIPALTLWNLIAESYAPNLKILIGRPLRGATAEQDPVDWSVRALFDRDLQKSITDAVTEALPARPILIRLNNSFRKRLFGRYGAPGIIEGDDGNLVEQEYLREYCARNLTLLESKANAWIPKLRALQDFYEARGHVFLYIITPSKVAHLPEKFVHRFPCAAAEQDRREYLSQYGRMLKAAGIRFVDTASLLHGLRGRYELELFPEGGTHWNMLGIAHAADAILAEINRAAGARVAPQLKWTFEVTDRPTGIDTDLYDVVNLLFARPRYSTAKVDFGAEPACTEWPAAERKIAMVGGSFLFGLAQTLINPGCLRGLEGYNYLYRGRRGGTDYRLLERRSGEEALLRLRDVDIAILEENEQVLPGSRHADSFHRIVLGE
jgi:hypothetical protein